MNAEQMLTILKEKSFTPQERMDVLLYLAKYFETTHLAVLETILHDASDHPDVRSGVALTLGKVGRESPEAARFFDILKPHIHDEDITVRNHVIQALGLLGRVEGIDPLIEALRDQNNTVFSSAAEALGDIGKPIIPYMIKLLETGAADARCVAAWKLGEVRDTISIPALMKAVKEDDNTEVKALAIWALGEMGIQTAEILETLTWAKAHHIQDVSERASLALKKIARYAN